MKRVDHIMQYLSGELSAEETLQFEQELSRDPELKEDCDQVSAAYHLIGEQLKQRDEEAFLTRLSEVMDKPFPGKEKGKGRSRPGWYFLISVAASMTVMLAIFLAHQGKKQTFARFFDPASDPVLLAIHQDTRGDAGSFITLYNQGHYAAAFEESSESLSLDPGDPEALLFQLLAALELDREEEALALVEGLETDPRQLPGQALAWYRALALVRSGRTGEATSTLEPLLVHPGPYKKDAHKLQKKLIK